MQMKMLVRIQMIERETQRREGGELRADFRGQLRAHARAVQKIASPPGHVVVEAVVVVDQVRNLLPRQHRAAIAQRQVQADAQLGQRAGASRGILHCRSADHEAGGGEDPGPMRRLDGLIDGRMQPEIIGGDDAQAPARVRHYSFSSGAARRDTEPSWAR